MPTKDEEEEDEACVIDDAEYDSNDDAKEEKEDKEVEHEEDIEFSVSITFPKIKCD